MSRWEELSPQLGAKAQRLQQSNEEWVARRRARQSYERWVHASIASLTSALHTRLQLRADQLARGGAVPFSLSAPRTVTVGRRRCITTIALGLSSNCLDVYAQWFPGRAPVLHFLLHRTRRGRAQRLICVPGGWLQADSAGSGVVVRPFGEPANQISVDDLAYRALRLLTLG